MIAHINLDDRLSILRAGDAFTSWHSLDDQRVCVLCRRKLKGRPVDIRRLPGGKFELCCPTLGWLCTPHQWRYAMVPVTSNPAKKHWPRVLPNERQHRLPESTLRMEDCRL
jgi:hypothetical protein